MMYTQTQLTCVLYTPILPSDPILICQFIYLSLHTYTQLIFEFGYMSFQKCLNVLLSIICTTTCNIFPSTSIFKHLEHVFVIPYMKFKSPTKLLIFHLIPSHINIQVVLIVELSEINRLHLRMWMGWAIQNRYKHSKTYIYTYIAAIYIQRDGKWKRISYYLVWHMPFTFTLFSKWFLHWCKRTTGEYAI